MECIFHKIKGGILRGEHLRCSTSRRRRRLEPWFP
jgi:hypothetical protein